MKLIKNLIAPTKRGKNILFVQKVVRITPNMIRVTLIGEHLRTVGKQHEGGNCKLILPEANTSIDDFTARLDEKGAFPVRTYTVRHARRRQKEIDIDFVSHGDSGPGSRWAESAKVGSFLGFMGPSMAKVTRFDAQWYFLAADLSALPMVAATIEAMPADAQGVAIIEVPSLLDQQEIESPKNIDIHWVVHADRLEYSLAQARFAQAIEWPECRVQVCVAGESNTIKSLKKILLNEKGVAKSDSYISGYWKIGLIEPEHQQFKKKSA